MNKIILSVGILGIALLTSFVLFGTSTTEYVAVVNDEITELESELELIEAAVEAGTLTPETAAKMQQKVYARIESVNTAVASGQKAKLTDAQRAQLVAGLDRLKQILINFKSTLVAVDESVLKLPEDKRPKLKSGGGGSKNGGIAVIVEETIADVDQSVEDIIEEITDNEILEEVEDILDTTVDDSEDGTEVTGDEINEDDETIIPEDEGADSTGGDQSTTSTEEPMNEASSTEGDSEFEDTTSANTTSN